MEAFRTLDMGDMIGTQTLTVSGASVSLINRSAVDITLTWREKTVTIPAGMPFDNLFNDFETLTITCPGSETWSYVITG